MNNLIMNSNYLIIIVKYDLFVDKVQHGYDLTNDFAEVFKIIKEQGINALERSL